MSSLKYLKREIEKIKKDGVSFLGMDGGNINADVWVCGVEFGSNLKQMECYYQEYAKSYDHKDYNIPFREDCPEFFLKSTYDRFLASLYISFFAAHDLTYPVVTQEIENVLRTELYHQDSQIFKLNLYPLAKKDMSWDKNIETQLGVTKKDYYNICFNNRVKFIKDLTKAYNPKVIICTSPKGYENTFVEAFLDTDQQVKFNFNYLPINNKKFKISVYENHKTKIIVIPFLGRGNLSSYKEVICMADYLTKEYIDPLPF